MHRFALDVAFLITITVASKGFRYIASVIVARNLSIDEYGYYAYFLQFAGYLSVLIELGLPTSIIVLNIRRGIELNKIFHIAILYICFSALLAYFFINEFINKNSQYSIIEIQSIDANLIIAYVFLVFLGSVLMSCIRAKQKNNQYSLLVFLLGLLTLITTLYALFFTNFELQHAIWAIILATFIWILILFFVNRDLLASFVLPKTSLVKEIFNFGFKNYITRILSSANQLIPFLFIAYSAYPEALGYFGAGAIIISLIRLLGQSISLLLTAKLSSLTNQDSFLFTIYLSSSLGLILLFFYPILDLSIETLISLIYGERYLPAVFIIKLSLIGVAFEVITALIIRPFITINNPRHYFQWLVYASTSLVLFMTYFNTSISGLPNYLELIGKGIALSNFVGFVVAIVLFVIVWLQNNRMSDK